MKSRSLLITFIYFLMTLILLVTSAMAWISLSSKVETGDIFGNISNYDTIRSFKVKKNDAIGLDENNPKYKDVIFEDGYAIINTINDMHVFFGETVPGDYFDFKIKIENKNKKDLFAIVNVFNMQSIINVDQEYQEEARDFDLKDVYYIENGTFSLIENEGSELETIQVYEFPILNQVTEPNLIKHGQELSPYRLNRLIDETNTLKIIDGVKIIAENTLTITFRLVYSQNTVHEFYQNGIFNFNAIHIYLV